MGAPSMYIGCAARVAQHIFDAIPKRAQLRRVRAHNANLDGSLHHLSLL
jgi:hypothetical protein